MFGRMYENPGFVLSANDECMFYKGSSRDREGYARMRFRVPGIVREKETSAHRMAKMVQLKTLHLGEGDASHRCHNKLCINPEHICIEDTKVNNARKVCVARGKCIGHDSHPTCLLDMRQGRF